MVYIIQLMHPFSIWFSPWHGYNDIDNGSLGKSMSQNLEFLRAKNKETISRKADFFLHIMICCVHVELKRGVGFTSSRDIIMRIFVEHDSERDLDENGWSHDEVCVTNLVVFIIEQMHNYSFFSGYSES